MGRIFSDCFDQWKLEVTEAGYELYNPGPNGEQRFYSMIPGPYGNPLFNEEPSLGFQLPRGVKYVNSSGVAIDRPEGKIGGIMGEGIRFSLSNAKRKGIAISLHPDDDGSILVGGEKWWIVIAFNKDAQRFCSVDEDGELQPSYTVIVVREKPEHINVLELGDLPKLLLPLFTQFA